DGLVELVRILLEYAADANQAMKDTERFTPLHVAAQGGHVRVMEELIYSGANIHNATTSGFTPLHSCAQKGHVDAMLLLLDAGTGL
ncbi:unnamed protein product, partial [Sphacelaria rigidula]